jgi:hypothetical protein
MNSYMVFYRGPFRLDSGQRSWELSCRSGITVPLQKLGKKGITGFPRIPAGKRNLETEGTSPRIHPDSIFGVRHWKALHL